jgi:transcription termination/antitermination protein NusG
MTWMALHVRPNAERKVQSSLLRRGLEEYLPCQRIKRGKQFFERPLFPGYVFAAAKERVELLQTPGVIRILGAVPDDQVAAVRRLLEEGTAVEPVPFVRAGERVRIVSGPLEGVEGYVAFVQSRARVVVSIELLHRSVAAEVDERWLVKLANPC